MAAVISSVTMTSSQPGSLVTINGSGFGATQGTTLLFFFPTGGLFQPLSVGTNLGESWSDTAIVVMIPTNADPRIPGFFSIFPNNGADPGVRSEPLVMVSYELLVAAPTDLYLMTVMTNPVTYVTTTP